MRRRGWVQGLLLGGLGLMLMGAYAACQEAAPTAAQLDADIRLLYMVNRLELTAEQIDRLLPIVRDMRTRAEALEKARNAPEIMQILRAVRQALLEGKSGQEVEALRRQLDQHLQRMDQQEADFGQARERAADLAIQVLTPEQQQRLLDPVAEQTSFDIIRAMGEARVVRPEHWDNWLAQVSQNLARQAAGGNPQAAQTAGGQIRQLLEQARGMSEAQLQAQAAQISARIEQILETAGADPSAAWLQDVRRQMIGELIFPERAQTVLEDKLKHLRGG